MSQQFSRVPAESLADDDLHRELAHLHETRHSTVLDGSEDALDAHTERMLALEREFLRRFWRESAPDPARTRAGRARAAPVGTVDVEPADAADVDAAGAAAILDVPLTQIDALVRADLLHPVPGRPGQVFARVEVEAVQELGG